MESSIIATPNISRGTQVANILTKALCKIHLDLLCNKLGFGNCMTYTFVLISNKDIYSRTLPHA